MNRLQRLFVEYGQSPWLDNLKWGYLTSGELGSRIESGIRGITSNPTIFQKAMSGQPDYDEQFDSLSAGKSSVDNAYWERPLWASTSTKNPAYSETLYVDELIGPDSVNTMPENTVEAFEQRGHLDGTIDKDVDQAEAVLQRLEQVGVSMLVVGAVLEEEGVSAFSKSFDELLSVLSAKADELAGI